VRLFAASLLRGTPSGPAVLSTCSLARRTPNRLSHAQSGADFVGGKRAWPGRGPGGSDRLTLQLDLYRLRLRNLQANRVVDVNLDLRGFDRHE